VNDTIGRQGRQRRSRLPRTGLLVAAAAVIATACGGGSTSSATTGLQNLGSLTNQALAYAKCMRAHGILGFPDPTVQDSAQSKGVGFSVPSSIDRSSARYVSASKLCQQKTGFGHVSTAQLQAGMNAMLKYAECMRSHGIASFPDPFENSHQVGFNITGIDQNSSRFKSAQKACQPLLPGGGP
jgi:hypothetical protein